MDQDVGRVPQHSVVHLVGDIGDDDPGTGLQQLAGQDGSDAPGTAGDDHHGACDGRPGGRSAGRRLDGGAHDAADDVAAGASKPAMVW